MQNAVFKEALLFLHGALTCDGIFSQLEMFMGLSEVPNVLFLRSMADLEDLIFPATRSLCQKLYARIIEGLEPLARLNFLI